VASKAARDPNYPVPAWYAAEPVPDEGTRMVVASFRDLSTERPIGLVPGYIPLSRIEDYAARRGVPACMMAIFTAAVRACDEEFLAWASRRRERASGKSAKE